MLVQRATCVNIYQYLKIGMNVIAEGRANFVKKQTPISGVWINVGAEGYVRSTKKDLFWKEVKVGYFGYVIVYY